MMEVDQFEEKIKLIESIDLKTASVKEIVEILQPIVGLTFFGSPLIDNSQFFYRAVSLPFKPFFFNDLIYPPKEKITRYQMLQQNRWTLIKLV
jgi:hypothetical protein